MKVPDVPVKYLAVGAAAVVAIYLVTKGTRAVIDTAADLIESVDPTNHDNIFAVTTNTIGGSIMRAGGPTTAGMNADGSWSLGGYIYDMTHRDAVTGKYAWWQF